MLEITIRQERAGDEKAVRAVNDDAFGRTLEGGIVDGVRGTDRWIDGGSLVAETPEGRIVGHLLISEGDLLSDQGPARRMWLIGQGQPVLCLVGHDTYYPRFGFTSARALGIEPPQQAWGDRHWMALRLPAWEPSCRGKVRFPRSFPD